MSASLPGSGPARTSPLLVIVIVLIAAAILLGGWAMGTYNNLVSLDEQTKSAWAQVDTVLQRRFDLIPNLVETVKGYAAHEKETLEEVTRLRSQWGAAKTNDEKAKAGDALEGALSRLIVVSEQYPDLKANQNFRDLTYELSGTENRIAVERQRYNDAVRQYNAAARRFPATLFGFPTHSTYFESAPAAKEAPKVDFGTKKAE